MLGGEPGSQVLAPQPSEMACGSRQGQNDQNCLDESADSVNLANPKCLDVLAVSVKAASRIPEDLNDVWIL